MATESRPTVGVIGLGAMGLGMARNLLTRGFPVVAYDIRPEPLAELVAAGATGAASPREVGSAADPVIVMVLDAAQLGAVIFGAAGLHGALRPGGTIIGCSTIPPGDARMLGATLARAGLTYIDAPVSGGKVGADAGTLTIMVGAEPEQFAAVRPVLEAIATRLYHTGPVGSGQATKMCHQVMAGVAAAATAECFALADAIGVDRQQLYEIVTHGAGDGWMFRHLGAELLAGSTRQLLRPEVWAKDLGIILAGAAQGGLDLPVVAAARQAALAALATPPPAP